ncbi:MAG: hypothetical protein WA324_15125 [Bryobacteraceae bacterium]
MLSRRRFVGYSALSSAMLACPSWLRSALGQTSSGTAQRPLRLAILGSVYHLGSNLQTIGDRFLVGYPQEGDWHMPNVQVVSVYVDQRVRESDAAPTGYERAMSGEVTDYNRLKASHGHPPIAHSAQQSHPSGTAAEPENLGLATDLSESRSKQFGFRLCRNIPEALRVGGSKIAVDAVLAIAEQGGDYPYSSNEMGQILLPTYDWFQQCVHVFEDENHVVPYFNHKQLSFSYPEAQNMVKTAARMKFPLLAGSSMPVTWRLPDVDVPLGAPVEEAVMVGVGSFDGMDFDALDAMQCMLERRKGGETGVKAVQLLEGDDVWAARKAGRWSEDLMSSALSRSDTPLGLTVLDGRTQDLALPGVLPQLVKDPAAYCIEYNDGTRATLLMLNGAIRDFNISARVTGRGMVSTQFFMPPAPNQTYSACLATKIEQMFQTGNAPYPVARALLTTGLLEACLRSRHRLNQRLETPQLEIRYQPPAESQYARA